MVVIVLWSVVGLNWLRFKDVLYPGLLQSCLWAIVVTAYHVLQKDFIPVGVETWITIGSGIVAFSMGAFVATYGHTPFRGRNHLRLLPMCIPAYVLVLISIIFLPLMLAKAYTFAFAGPFQNYFANLRYAMTIGREETGGYGSLKYLIPLVYLSIALQLLRRFGSSSVNGNGMLFISIAVGTIYGILTSGRAILLMLFLIIFMIPVVLRAMQPIRTFIVLIIITLFMFISLGILMGKGGSIDRGILENIRSMTTNIKVYLLGSIPAFDQLIKNGSSYDMGLHTFRTVFAVLNFIGYDVSVKQLVQDFVYVPMPTNVYTVYQPYYQDFGLFTAVLFQYFFGLVHGFIYRKATTFRPHPFYVFWFAISMFPLISQYGGDSYFSLLSMWVQYLIYSSIFLIILSRRNKGVS